MCIFEGNTVPKLLNMDPKADLNMWLCMMLVELTSGFKDTNTVNNDTPKLSLNHISIKIPIRNVIKTSIMVYFKYFLLPDMSIPVNFEVILPDEIIVFKISNPPMENKNKTNLPSDEPKSNG